MSYRDLELVVRIQQWDGDQARATLDGDEPCGETTCHRVVLVPAGPNEFPCRRFRLWYSRDDLLLRCTVHEVTCDVDVGDELFSVARLGEP